MAKIRPKIKLVEVMNKYIGAPYKLGGCSRHEGYDCFSLALALGEDFGINVPDTFSGQTMDTYSELWLDDPAKAKKIMLDLFGELGEEIPFSKAFVGDVLLLEDEEGDNVGIHAGKDLVLSAFTDIGVQLASINSFKINGVYRWAVQDIGT